MSIALYGWCKIKYFVTEIKEKTVNISLLIPFCNEERHLPVLIESLKKQTCFPSEIIFIDDHSTDNSVRIIEEAKNLLPIITLLKNDVTDTGKKAALENGLKAAGGEWILQTDADCTLPPRWIETYTSFFCRNPLTVMVAGPVAYSRGNSLFSWFYELDFLSLVFSGAGFTGVGKPIYCNGANMAYKKEAVNMLNDPFVRAIASGDDVFLMQQMAAGKRGNVTFLKSRDVIVQTVPPDSPIGFIKQRIRWGAKTPGYPQFFAKYVAVVVFVSNFTLVLMWILVLSQPFTWTIAAAFTMIKLISDISILVPSLKFSRKYRLASFIIPAFVLYPFYITITAVISLTGKHAWK
jgi:cellulose synthase/poly-beta-1,6-N-acetylglucosamine synthase-like glycosyltransferase